MEFDLHHFLQGLDELLRSSGLDNSYGVWAQLAIVLMGLFGSTGLVGYLSGRYKFRKRSFFDQMVVGVNMFEMSQGRCTLKLRTLVEDNLNSLLDNPTLERLVVRAAKKCTESDMILRLKSPEDHALLLTKVQNAISASFAKEYVLQMLGQGYENKWVEFVVTCERYGGLKATKIRVLVFIKEHVQQLVDPQFFNKIAVEEPHHADRLRTLRLIAVDHLADKDAIRGRVEIPLVP